MKVHADLFCRPVPWLPKFDPSQPQRVGDDGDGGQTHRRRCNHRRQEQTGDGIEQSCCDRHADGVVGEGEEQVLLDVAQGSASQFPRPHDAHQVAAQKRDACAFHRHVGTGAHGDANIGGGEGRGVIHAVARHSDLVAVTAQLVDQVLLCFRQNSRAHLVDAELTRHRLRRAFVIARRHYDV